VVGVGRPPSHTDEKGTAVNYNYQSGLPDSSAAACSALPETVSVAMAEIVADMREGLLSLAVGAGLQVMGQLMDAEVAAVCGPRGRHDPVRAAVRHGRENGSVTLGGRRVPVRRPRMRTADGAAEVPVPSYELFSQTEILGRLAMQKMLAGISTRGWPAGLEPVGQRAERAATSTSKFGDLPPVRRRDRDRAGRIARPAAGRAGPGGVADRRRVLR